MSETDRKYRVLFVDDEPRVTSALKAIFRREYEVAIANSGAEALEVLAKQQFDVIVSDQRMPGMLGNELLAEVFKLYPQTMRILLTGFMDKQAIVDSINDGEVYRFINKPWRNDEMREVVAEAALASEIPVIPLPDTSANKEPESEATASASKSEAPTQRESVKAAVGDQALLMMEQAKDIRHQIRKFCSDHSIMIYGTQNIEQAVAAATARESIGVAVIELSNNTTTALQTINLLKQARPEVITIALTEEYDAHTAVDLINQGQVFKYLAKPIDLAGFENTIENAFVKHRFLKKNKAAQKRFKVEKTRGKVVAGLQDLFNRFLGSSSDRAAT
ncbi:MAG: response regulator [Acidiferrobacterales bacterium]|nr:response regulator [Acidiferrobacterales bacterium]